MEKDVFDWFDPKNGRTGGLRILDPVLSEDDWYGGELLVVTKSDMEALLAGKVWRFPINGGEYIQLVALQRKGD